MDDNEVFKSEYERLQKQGLSNAQIYQALIDSGMTQEELTSFAKYINANAKVQGMVDGTQMRIVQNVRERVMEWSYKGELNGEKQSGENMVYVTDDKGRTLVVASGDVAFDSEGNPKEDVGDMLVVYDTATGEVDFVSAKEVKFHSTESAEDFGKRYTQHLQELNSRAYVEAAQEQQGGENVPQQEGTGAKPQSDESTENHKQHYSISEKKSGNGESFYQDENGNIDLANISDEIFDKIGYTKAPFRLTPSMIKHMLGRHGKELGFSTEDEAIDFVRDVMSNFDHVRLGNDGALVFSIENNRKRTGKRAVTVLINSDNGEFYGLKTSGYESVKGLEKRPLLWERGANEASSTDAASANVPTGKGSISGEQSGSASNHSNDLLYKDSNSSSENGENKQTLTFTDGSPIPMTTDSKGRPTGDLTKMSPEHGAEYLETTLGEMTDEFVDGKIAAAEKAIDKAKKKKVDMSGDIGDVQEAVAKKNEEIAKAEAELNMYTGIKKAMTEKKVKAAMEAYSGNGKPSEASLSLSTPGDGKGEGGLAVARTKFEGGQRIVGNKRTRTLVDGTKIKGHYELVEAESLTPSHDATDGYKKSEGFPLNEEGRTMNDRDYEHDKDAQRVTDMIARNYDGQAVDQVPVVTEDGIVVDGNGRTMAGQKAAKDGTDGAYLEALKENAENYGFTAEQVDGMKHPRLVLVSDEKMTYDTATFAKFNRSEKKAQDNTQQAVGNSKKLTSDEISAILSEVEGAGSLDAFFKNPAATNSLLKRLIDKGVIGLNEVAALREGEDKLSAQGKDFVKNLLLGSVFSEDTIRMMGKESELKTKALNGIRAVIENMKLGEYALTSEIDKAVQLLYEARQGGVGADALLRTPSMFGDNAADRYDPISQAIALALEGKAEDFRELMLAYNKNAEHLSEPRQLEMFGEKPTKEEFINEFLKLRNWKDYETRHSSEEGAGDAGGSKRVEQEARGGSEEEGQQEVAEGIKTIATEITKRVGEDLVVTDEKTAEKKIAENETEIDGNKLKFQIKTPEQRKAAENAYNWAQQHRPSEHTTYAVVDMSRPDAIPQYFEKKDLAKQFKKYWSVISNGEYKLVNLDKTFEENVKDFTGDVPDVFNPSGMKFHKESDEEVLERLDNEPKVKVYRAMQVMDGKLYPPMAASVNGKRVEANELGVWIRSDENPDLAIPDIDPKTGNQKVDPKTGELKWKFKLDKGGKDATGKKATNINAAYNPYWHTSRSPLNDQFKSAWIRPNIVIVECEVPESELTSGYKAERAKDAVGEVDWKSGSVSGEIYNQTGRARKVILSRWCKPIRVLSDAEFAQKAKEYIGEADVEIPENVVTPKQRVELEKLGVKIGKPEKGVNKSEQIAEALEKGLLVDNSLKETDSAKRMEFRTKDGEVYGFTDGKKIYLDTKKMKPDTALHEYTHLWGGALRRVNQKEWENVKGLLDKVDGLKKEIQKLYPELKGDDLYDEMLAMFSGREGTKKLEAVCRKLAAEEGKRVTDSAKEQGFIDKVKTALQKFWKATADLLHVHFTSAEDVADKVLADWARGFDPREVSDDSGSRETSGSRKIADPLKGMENAAEAYREEQRLKLQKKDSEEDEKFVSLPTVWLPKDEYAKLSSAIHTHNDFKNGEIGYDFTDNNFYVYTYDGDGRFTVNHQLEIVGNEKLIGNIKDGIKFGTITRAESVDRIIEDSVIERDKYNRSYADTEGRRGSDEGLSGVSPLRQSHERRGDERVDTKLSQSASAEHISAAIAKTAEKTGGKVKQVHSVEEITNEQVRKDIESGKEMTGWYDEKTGEVHLYMPNIHDSYTAEKTVWHETVGHKGMRGLLGDKFHKYLRSLWMDMDSPVFEELHKYVKERMAKEPLSMYDAIEEFIADAAEKGKGEAGFWNNVKNKVADALHEIGYRLCPNVKDVKYMLWLAKNVQKHGNDPVWKMRAEAAKWKIDHDKTEYTTTEGGEIRSVDGKAHGFESMTKEEWNEATDGEVHYRTSPSAATALDRYHRMLGAHGYMAVEAFADNMAAVDRLMRALDPTIKRIEDVSAGMNPYMLRTVLDGAASDKMQRFEADVMQPLDKYMARLIDTVDGKNDKEKIRNFNLYMIKKHGLERNRVFFVRDAVKNMGEKKRKQTLADFNTERKALGDQLRKGVLTLSQYYTELDKWIRQKVNKNYKAGEHDYSGWRLYHRWRRSIWLRWRVGGITTSFVCPVAHGRLTHAADHCSQSSRHVKSSAPYMERGRDVWRVFFVVIREATLPLP